MIRIRINPIIFTLVAIAAMLTFSASKATAQQAKGESILNKGDSIAVYVDAEDFDALKAAKKGDNAKIKILENFIANGKKLINKSAPVFCTVTQRSKGGMYGGAGKLEVRIDSTHSNAKTMIPLKGLIALKGKRSTPKTVISIVLFPVGWLIKGSDVEFPEGKNVFKAVFTGDTKVDYLK